MSHGAAGVFTRFAERRVGPLTGEAARAANVTQAFLIFAFALTVAYAIFFALYDADAMRPIVISAVVTSIVFAVDLVVVHRGHQLAASVIALMAGTVHVTVVTAYLGWIAGLHLYLIAGGQLVFMVFTERQRALRWAYVGVAIAAFSYCQLVVPERGRGFTFPAATSEVMFSVNATVTLLLMYTLAAISYYSAVRIRALADGATARAEYLANTDELTGLPNRRPVLRRLDELSATSSYSLAIADLDHFKRLNDTFGHECGDRVLAAIGARLREGLRTSDSVGRWGGEEFIFVMAESTIEDAVTTMERMRVALAAPLPCAGHSHEVTISVGVTDAQPDGMAHRALQRADSALYEAKAAGRDAVRWISGPAPADGVEPTPRRRRA